MSARNETDWTEWKGGNAAPHDWDKGPVLFRDGTVSDLYADGWDWSHTLSDPPHVRAVEIIAYRKAAA